MSLFSKLKNVLFEEEEIEVPVEPETSKKVEQPVKVEKKPVKMTFEDEKEDVLVSDRELFKAEKTFDFPVFDDEEFERLKKPVVKKEEEPKSMGINLFDYEKPKNKDFHRSEIKTEEIKGRAYSKQRKEEPTNSKFRPSPVISPVYGVLDKNYKKEDFEAVKVEKKNIDVDDVRKKAFGTLEDDIEKTISKKPAEFYNVKPKEEEKKMEKSIEDLLEESAYDKIAVDEKDLKQESQQQLEPLDIPRPKSNEEHLKEDTIESDLFDLIDSMYENREDD